MKTVLLASLVALSVSACSDNSQTMYSVTIKEEVIETKSVVVHDVMFVNDKDGYAVTRVILDGEAPLAPVSMVKYDFPGYHPEVIRGTLAVLEHLHWSNGFNNRYILRLCVVDNSTQSREKLCAEKP